MASADERCPSCSAQVHPADVRCRACGQVLGEDNRCDSCHALAPLVRRGGRLVCSACGAERARLARTVVTSELVSELSVGVSQVMVRVYAAIAVIVALIGLVVGAVVGTFAQNTFEVVLASIMGGGALLIAALLARASLKLRKRNRARERSTQEQRLLGLAAQRNGVVTADEVARHLGISVAEADAMLDALVRAQQADIDVTEHGEIRFVLTSDLSAASTGSAATSSASAASTPKVAASRARSQGSSQS